MVSRHSRFSPAAAISIALLVILSGCGKSQLYTRPLSELHAEQAFTCSENGIHGSYTALRSKSCARYLGCDVVSKGYQPIYITLTNNTHQAVQFSHKQISLPTIPANKVAAACHLNTAARAVGAGAPGCFFGIPGMLVGAFVTMATPSLSGGAGMIGGIVAGVGLFIAGTAVVVISLKQGPNAAKTNEEIDNLFVESSLVDVTINPNSTMSGFIFVPKKEFNPNFQITLTDSTGRAFVLRSSAQ